LASLTEYCYVMSRKVVLILCSLLLWSSSGEAFFLTAIQEGEGYALKGEEVIWDLFRSEPFQGVIYDLKAPQALIYAPDKKPRLVALRRIKILDHASGKKRFAWQAHFVPDTPGDYYLVLHSEPTLVSGLPEVWEEWVKVPLHVEQSKSWARPLGLRVEIVPSVRPYGLMAGTSFSARVFFEGRPASRVRLQMVPFTGVYLTLKELPQDENGRLDIPLMYLDLLTDEQGGFTVSFPHPGWWLLSAVIPIGQYRLGQEQFPFYLRASLWLYLKPPFKVPETAPHIRPESN